MCGILSEASRTIGKRLIIQPQTKQDELRDWLCSRGFTISDASLVYDTGRIYLVWLVEAGIMPRYRGLDEPLLRHRDELLKPYLEEQLKRLRKRLHGVEHAAQPNEPLCAELHKKLAELEEIYREVTTWQA